MAKGHENLIPMSERTSEEVRKIGAKGGKKSGEARRRKRTTKELLEMILSKQTDNSKMRKLLQELGYKQDEITNDLAMNFSMVNKVISKGDSKAYNTIQNILGELKEQVSIVGQPKLKIEVVDNENLESVLYEEEEK